MANRKDTHIDSDKTQMRIVFSSTQDSYSETAQHEVAAITTFPLTVY